ncbi:MAG: Txe/YoeB family addiction module toxin [Cyclobacteriaceae bacterium]
MTLMLSPGGSFEFCLYRINAYLCIERHPFKGLGKPEPLKGNLAGYWSRRVTNEHRLVYRVHGTKPDQVLTTIQARSLLILISFRNTASP